jgi:hypothetical protein
MLRPFKLFEERGDFVVASSGAQSQCARRYLELATWLRLARLSQAQGQQVVDDRLEWLAAAADLLFQEDCDVIVDGKSCSHIMMLISQAS